VVSTQGGLAKRNAPLPRQRETLHYPEVRRETYFRIIEAGGILDVVRKHRSIGEKDGVELGGFRAPGEANVTVDVKDVVEG
jgi:hypothetical protein